MAAIMTVSAANAAATSGKARTTEIGVRPEFVTFASSGIPAEVLPHIFRPMLTTKPEGKGTGLGLPICRDVVRAHGGEIRAESQVGIGTTMVFSLPAA